MFSSSTAPSSSLPSLPMSGFMPFMSSAPMYGTPMRSSSSGMPFSPITSTFLPVDLKSVWSRYAAAAKDELRISSGSTSSPSESNLAL